MPCPTCSETMQCVCPDDAGRSVHWCPRCGTLRIAAVAGGIDEHEPPKLVGRCRSFAFTIAPSLDLTRLWKRLGIAEAINVPANRPAE